VALVDKQDNAALPGSINAAFYEVSTLFVVQAIPKPSVWVMVVAGVVSVGVSVRWQVG
jgi:hypothetical protein